MKTPNLTVGADGRLAYGVAELAAAFQRRAEAAGDGCMMGTAAEDQIRQAFNGAPQAEPAPLPQPEEPPTLEDAALHGVVGEYVRLIEKRTESHRAALVSLSTS
jgi:hypothetical protein